MNRGSLFSTTGSEEPEEGEDTLNKWQANHVHYSTHCHWLLHNIYISIASLKIIVDFVPNQHDDYVLTTCLWI